MIWPKKIDFKTLPLRGSKSPLIWWFIEFFRSKKFSCKISLQSGIKIVYFFLMDLNLFRQDIKKINLLTAFQQNVSSSQKTADFCHYWQILVKNCCRFIASHLIVFFLFFALIFFPLTLATIFVSASFLPKVSKVKERGWKLNFDLWKW